MRKHLVLITIYYPYGKGEPFLETEIKYLSETFESVLILPMIAAKGERPLPENVVIDNRLRDISFKSGFKKYLEYSRHIFSKHCLKDISVMLKRGKFKLSNLHVSLDFLYKAGLYLKEIEQLIRTKKWDKREVCLYSYWYDMTTVATAMYKRKNPEVKCISRAHRFDLYEIDGLYQPYKYFTGRLLDRIFPVSVNGAEYLYDVYGVSKDKIVQSNLGVENDFDISRKTYSADVLKIVSVAYISPRKRIDLVAESLLELSKIDQKLKVIWYHIGDGSDEIKERINEIVDKYPSTVQYHFLGNYTNQQVGDFYKENLDIDLFISLSNSEGKPVSIMEAHSYAIPVVASNVGGIAEQVNEDNGSLLSEDLSALEIAKKLYSYKSVELRKRKSIASLGTWRADYDARRNYTEFMEYISK